MKSINKKNNNGHLSSNNLGFRVLGYHTTVPSNIRNIGIW